MLVRLLLCCALFGVFTSAFSQGRYIVFFSDKGEKVDQYFQHPDGILSNVTIEKRNANSLPIDYYDLPVSRVYLHQLEGNGIRVIRSSKWLNASLVETTIGPAQLAKLSPGIVRVTTVSQSALSVEKTKIPEYSQVQNPLHSNAKGTVINYGAAARQDTLLGIDYLHNLGITGAGVTIAFLDAGFPGIDTNAFFASLYNSNRIKGTYDFWTGNSFVYHKWRHGTLCSSEVLGNQPGFFVGMAPDANAMFAIVDDSATETHQDEFNYVAALEWADSLGADIISASVSYSIFDSGYSYTYPDMNGHTAITTIGCTIAARKGLLIVSAAGNSGIICAPCDADSILCVGGANSMKQHDNISSHGPSYDQRIKPDVAALTLGTYSVGQDGQLYTANYNGTSASTPMVAGLAACLKQAHPTATNIQIINAIKKSSNRYTSPNAYTGYGVPNARKADSVLSVLLGVGKTAWPVQGSTLATFPNPVHNILFVRDVVPIQSVVLYSMIGQEVARKTIDGNNGSLDISSLPSGTYWLQAVYSDGAHAAVKVSKQ